MLRITTLSAVALLAAAAACGDVEDEPVLDTEIGQPATEPAPAATEGDAAAAAFSVATLNGAGEYLTDASGRALYLLEGEPEGRTTCTDACAEAWPPYTPQGTTGMQGGTGTTYQGTTTNPDQPVSSQPTSPTRESATQQPAQSGGAAMPARSGTGTQIRADRISTITRPDGTRQYTYNGHALYYYHDDTQRGQTTGHDKTDQWGEWYLVTPEGEPLESSSR